MDNWKKKFGILNLQIYRAFVQAPQPDPDGRALEAYDDHGIVLIHLEWGYKSLVFLLMEGMCEDMARASVQMPSAIVHNWLYSSFAMNHSLWLRYGIEHKFLEPRTLFSNPQASSSGMSNFVPRASLAARSGCTGLLHRPRTPRFC